jgi:hypothetical protein
MMLRTLHVFSLTNNLPAIESACVIFGIVGSELSVCVCVCVCVCVFFLHGAINQWPLSNKLRISKKNHTYVFNFPLFGSVI